MESIRHFLCKDVSLIIFEFLINGENYNSFVLKDIVEFNEKIYNWDMVLLWSLEINNKDTINYSKSKFIWMQTCVKCSTFNCEDPRCTYIIEDEEIEDFPEYEETFEDWDGMCQMIFEEAINSGNYEISEIVYSSMSSRDAYFRWEVCMILGFRSGRNEEILRYVESKVKDWKALLTSMLKFFPEEEKAIEYVKNCIS
uniref:Uncharacterized protein n=1 Tax=Pithovirus LCPAC403 TaxID=2506596 RepID=A0A481ZAR9_9VIRU|nr:MAG: hypothetical protein LCPAC403_01480 [Pithovirus LCPAC403]